MKWIEQNSIYSQAFDSSINKAWLQYNNILIEIWVNQYGLNKNYVIVNFMTMSNTVVLSCDQQT